MQKFKGKGVYGAVAIGNASVITRQAIKTKRIHVDDIENELRRVDNAKKKAINELTDIYEKALKEVGETGAQIFEIHIMMIEDDDYNESIRNIIRSQGVNAEYAVSVTGVNFAEMFSSMDDSYMRARASDIKDISNRIIYALTDSRDLIDTGCDKIIICADDLAPSETVSLSKDKIYGFATAYGSSSSHTSILARNMNIPAVIGLGEGFLKAVKNSDAVAIDGYTGEVYIDPDGEILKRFEDKIKEDTYKKKLLETLRGKENITLDGKKIKLYANIGGIDNIGSVLYNDADGIGLFRSEFIYLDSNDYPSEETQFNIYKKVLESMSGKKVIIRTLDIGADKQADYFGIEKEENPALGYRAIRICLDRPDIFKTQLRALFRASVYGELSIMFPMIISEDEVKRSLQLCNEVKRELDTEGIKYAKKIEIGIMIETPAAAVISDILAPYVDFFSIGTNDLIQYTLACDRQNPLLESVADTHHTAILRLIEYVVSSAHKHGKWVGICGELASDTTLTENFLRIGIDELSVSPSLVLPVRQKIRSIRLKK